MCSLERKLLAKNHDFTTLRASVNKWLSLKRGMERGMEWGMERVRGMEKLYSI